MIQLAGRAIFCLMRDMKNVETVDEGKVKQVV